MVLVAPSATAVTAASPRSTSGSAIQPRYCSASLPQLPLVCNLRHCRSLGAAELHQLLPEVERLWLGPSFDPLLTFAELANNLPDSLLELDLDLTSLLLRDEQGEGRPDGGLGGDNNIDGRNEIDLEEGADAQAAARGPVRAAREGLQVLFRRLTRLRSLCLRLPDVYADGLVAQAVAECLPDGGSSALTTLDLRQGAVGAAGVAALGWALRRRKGTLGCAALRELMLDCRSGGTAGTATASSTAEAAARALADLLVARGGGAVRSLRRLDVGWGGGGNGDLTDAALEPLCDALRRNRTLTDLGLFGCSPSRLTVATGVRLRDALRDGNATLERLAWHGSSSVPPAILQELDWYLRLNRAGRRYLRDDPPPEDAEDEEAAAPALPLALWPRLLARISQPQSSSLLFYFVQHKVDLLLHAGR